MYRLVVWVGDQALATRTPSNSASVSVPLPAGETVDWWRDPAGPMYVARVVQALATAFGDGELVAVTVLVPADARPRLDAALGFAIPDVDVAVLPVHEAVAMVLGGPALVGEWRAGQLAWSGEGERTVVIAPSAAATAVECRVREERAQADVLTAERLLERCAETLEPPADVEPDPVVVDDDVQFTVYRPRAVRPEVWEQLLAFAHKTDEYEEDGQLVDPVREVTRQATEVLGDLSRHVTSVRDANVPIARGDTLRFVPVVPGITFNPSALEFRWLRGVHREAFEFRAGRELDGQTVAGRLSVYVGLVLVADVTLRLRIDSGSAVAEQERSRGRVYGKVFPSYSHADAEVVGQIATAARTLGHEYLRDVEQLRAGQDWQRELERYIDDADIFQLFWSPASMVSPHVQHEWSYALSLNRPDFVRPVFWQLPRASAPPTLPPPELDRLHFAYLGAAPPVTPPSAAAPTFAAPAAPPSPARRSLRSVLAGAGVAAVAGVAVTIGVTGGGGAPSASPPPVASASPPPAASASPTHSVDPLESPLPSTGTGTSVPPDRPPSSTEAEAVVVAFFAALDDGDANAALRMVCGAWQAALDEVLTELAGYRWDTPEVVTDAIDGADRVLVVKVTASDGGKTYAERLRLTVSRSAFGAEICGLEEA